jgi:general secretion pathway protein C
MCLLCLLLMGLSLAWQAAQWWRLVKAPIAVAAPVRQLVASAPPALDRLQVLFGTPGASASREAPPTTLQLTLLASFMHPEQAAALIAPAGGKARRLTVGDEVSPGVTVQAVFKDHVLLSRHGVQERLSFPQRRANAAVSNYAADTAAYAAPQDFQPPLEDYSYAEPAYPQSTP